MALGALPSIPVACCALIFLVGIAFWFASQAQEADGSVCFVSRTVCQNGCNWEADFFLDNNVNFNGGYCHNSEFKQTNDGKYCFAIDPRYKAQLRKHLLSKGY